MEERMRALENEVRRTRFQLRVQSAFGLGALVTGLCLFGGRPALTRDQKQVARDQKQVVRAPFRVVNARGRTLFEVEEEKGQPVARLYNAAGRKAAGLSGLAEGGEITMYDRGGGRLAVLGALTKQGQGGLVIFDDRGRPAGVFNSDSKGGNVTLYDRNGGPLTGMSIGEEGGQVMVFHKTGKPAVGVSATGTGGMVSVYGREGKGGAALAVMERGGGLVIWDSLGKEVFSAPPGPASPMARQSGQVIGGR